MNTQYQKILELHSDGKWHCNAEYWRLFIRSPHKRRSEMERMYGVRFEWIPCEHSHRNVRDYLLIPRKEPIKPVEHKQEALI